MDANNGGMLGAWLICYGGAVADLQIGTGSAGRVSLALRSFSGPHLWFRPSGLRFSRRSTRPNILECGGLFTLRFEVPPLLRTRSSARASFFGARIDRRRFAGSPLGLRVENHTKSAHNIEKLAHAPVLFVACLD